MANDEASILIIDDSEDNRVLLAHQLRKFGYKVTSATDGREGLAAIEAQSLVKDGDFDMVLLDLLMPRMSGMDVLRAIRKNHPSSLLPVIILTAMVDADTTVEALKQGANDYISMPSDLQVLLARVASHISAKKARESIVHARENLEKCVLERTSELQRKNAKLSRLYNTAHQFVDNVSHEFRTPLTVIREYASMLKDRLAGPLNEDQDEFVRTIISRTDDLSCMVDDMLDMSKLEADLLGVRRARHEVAEIVARVTGLIERKAAASKVTLKIELPGDLPSVFCDEENIGRVICNLVVNACKFSDDGGQVTLWARADSDNNQVQFGVTDNGPGIEPEYAKMIFERFKQAGRDIRSSAKGFGLGLSIARELVHVNFGAVSLESAIGEGSTFSFTVPVFDYRNIIERYLDFIRKIDNIPPFLSMLRLDVDAGISEADSEEVDEFLHQKTRWNDLVVQVGATCWLICVAANHSQLKELVGRLMKAREESNRNRPRGPLVEFRFDAGQTWHMDRSETFVKAFDQACHAIENRDEPGPAREQEEGEHHEPASKSA